ncbi:hypothetical protein [Methanobacterium oryzae]|uniref:hypothetical protein n=1 Tax=Methanobacterium oryzae TaxID=69540 RepID=UPI003D2378F3
MSKNRDLKELTLKIIGEKELSKKKLLDELRKKSNISDKTLNEILMSFLKDKKICITGYDFDVYTGIKRIQSIKSDGIVFGLIKTDPIEIDILIKQLESDDPSKVKDALYRLKIIFKKKIEQADDGRKIYIQNADDIFNKVIFQIKSCPDDQKAVLRNKLALCLSGVEGSDELFEHFINYINSK